MTTANPYPQGRLGEVWQRGYDGKPRTPTSERGSDPHLSARVWRAGWDARLRDVVGTANQVKEWQRLFEAIEADGEGDDKPTYAELVSALRDMIEFDGGIYDDDDHPVTAARAAITRAIG